LRLESFLASIVSGEVCSFSLFLIIHDSMFCS
jgi:hypothetical protein